MQVIEINLRRTVLSDDAARKRETKMSLFDDEEVKKPPVHEIGQDLSLLSVDELHERIEMLKAEIIRLETEAGSKDASRSAAESFFKN